VVTSFVEHISVRVAWHDHGWDGTVCRDPAGNASCILLKNVGPNREDDLEVQLAGQGVLDGRSYVPPCINERATFMAPKALSVVKPHPFRNNPALKAVRPTRVPMPPYTAHATPYRWMLREEVSSVTAEREGVYRPELEERVDRAMGWKRPGAWVMHGENQGALFEEFFRTVVEATSLVFFYAKHTPLADDPQRVLVGAARVAKVELPGLYDTAGDPAYPSLLWETVVHHTLRPEMTDGILLPYQALLAASDQDPSLDISRCIAHAPADAWTSFSFVTEHVSHDVAIDALLVLEQAARAASEIVGGIPPSAFMWVDDQVNQLWQLRGPCPGLGSALTAFGVERGTLLAHALAKHIDEGSDPWPAVERAFADPDALGPEIARHLTPTQCRKWSRLGAERKELLRLLSRFALSTEQVQRWYRDPEGRGGGLTDAAILANPYLPYEEDRGAPGPIAVSTIDRGVLPMEPIASAHPLAAPSAMADSLDERRVRALVVDALEHAAAEGHTLLPEVDVVGSVRARPLGQPCPLDTDTLDALDLSASALKATADGPIVAAQLASGAGALQLSRLASVGSVIRSIVDQRLRAARHAGAPDLSAALAAELGALPGGAEAQELEERAREEKLAALKELFESRVSVLTGSAGTGKTTLLRVLCTEPAVVRGGVLLLAPTGKARVQLTTKVGQTGYTIAQFLVPTRYDTETGRYIVTGDAATRRKTFKTVVIDEASMLTEEQLAATLDALAGVERLILVGDHRQLPPIGAGRPFVDIVTRLAPANIDATFPRVAPGYAELTVQRRQEGADRDDMRLAAWFGGGELAADADDVWQRLRTGEPSRTLRAARWSRATLHDDLVRVLSEELQLPDADGVVLAFEQSYGGTPGDDGRVWFNWRRDGGAGTNAEKWQLLAPVRARAWGTTEINRHLKGRFRRHALDAALKPPWERWFPEPVGPEQIVYGDKVMNVKNTRFSDRRVFPKEDALRYVANGEIGVVVGQAKGGKVTWTPNKTEIEFSSQPGFKYDFYDWSDAADSPLELAWAITVHKAQGSEFELVILVLPENARALSRELFYTALTRQRRRVVIFHEGDLDAVIDAAAPGNSETARRLTNLFEAPAPVQVAGERLDDRLIHRTTSGVLVRSKNEVIIANLLTQLGVDWTYEEPFPGDDGRIVRPDFTIRTDAGLTVLWEHLGMLDNLKYRRKWEIKRAWYETNGVAAVGEPATRATLLATEDTEGVDSEEWEALARSVLGL
jgi:AAA domain/UvrD-like helicase C-terminal domain